MFKKLSALMLMLALAPAAANAFGVKDYHKEVMTGDNGKVECAACHGDAKRKTIPDAAACEACHGTPADVAEMTKRADPHDIKVEPNPHDSLHYGTDLPCTYCHMEHKESKVYCNQCHEFTYPDMKR